MVNKTLQKTKHVSMLVLASSTQHCCASLYASPAVNSFTVRFEAHSISHFQHFRPAHLFLFLLKYKQEESLPNCWGIFSSLYFCWSLCKYKMKEVVILNINCARFYLDVQSVLMVNVVNWGNKLIYCSSAAKFLVLSFLPLNAMLWPRK